MRPWLGWLFELDEIRQGRTGLCRGHGREQKRKQGNVETHIHSEDIRENGRSPPTVKSARDDHLAGEERKKVPGRVCPIEIGAPAYGIVSRCEALTPRGRGSQPRYLGQSYT